MRPSILHGDLQFSNAGVVESPYGRYDIVVFDPCSFYGSVLCARASVSLGVWWHVVVWRRLCFARKSAVWTSLSLGAFSSAQSCAKTGSLDLVLTRGRV
eukprot:1743982-Rhodomonas_salina.3